MIRRVDMIYDVECPNVPAAREQLRRAMARVGGSSVWYEWERNGPDCPPDLRQYGSPTILVDGRDVAAQSPEANCCRLYRHRDGKAHGVPAVETIVAALQNAGDTASQQRAAGRWSAWAPMAPAVVISLLPKLACPACWPAYAGLLGTVGLGFLTQTTYLLPLTVLFLIVAVGALAWRGECRRGRGPFFVGLLAAAIVVGGKFGLDSNSAMYAGIALLAGASLWNSWPSKSASASCPACEPAGRLHEIGYSKRRYSNG